MRRIRFASYMSVFLAPFKLHLGSTNNWEPTLTGARPPQMPNNKKVGIQICNIVELYKDFSSDILHSRIFSFEPSCYPEPGNEVKCENAFATWSSRPPLTLMERY